MTTAFKEKYIADKKFYQRTFKIIWPITINNMVSSTMEIIDSIVVASIGMTTAVSNATQITSLYYSINFGISSAFSIYAAQYFGAKQYRNLKRSFGLNCLISVGLSSLFILAGLFFGKEILSFYLNDEVVVSYGLKYLSIGLWVLPIHSLAQSFSTYYRCIGEQKFSMFTAIVSSLSNLFFDYGFVLGKFGLPELGIKGAALATLLSQSIMLAVYVYYGIHIKAAFLGNLKEMGDLSIDFIKEIFEKALPLIVNETIFGFGTSLFAKAYGYLGTDSMTAYYIGNQIYNICQFAVWGFGASVAIILGTSLGEGKIEQAIKEKDYFMFITVCMDLVIVPIMVIFAPVFVWLFKQTDASIIANATGIVRVLALKAAIRLFNYVSFAILRSGGETKKIQLLDSGVMWLVGLPLAFSAVLLFKIQSIVLVLLISQGEQLFRMIFLLREVKTNKWANNLTGKQA